MHISYHSFGEVPHTLVLYLDMGWYVPWMRFNTCSTTKASLPLGGSRACPLYAVHQSTKDDHTIWLVDHFISRHDRHQTVATWDRGQVASSDVPGICESHCHDICHCMKRDEHIKTHHTASMHYHDSHLTLCPVCYKTELGRFPKVNLALVLF
jgi:hypothetical protein